MNHQYYAIVNGERRGPLGKEALRALNISGDTLVWRAGMADWQRADELEEMLDVLTPGSANAAPGEPYFAMMGERRVGPLSAAQLVEQGLRPDTPVWQNGMPDWAPASTRQDLMSLFNERMQQPGAVPPNPYYDSQGRQTAYGTGFGQQTYVRNPYGTPNYGAPNYGAPTQPPVPHTDWLVWAIVGTVIGLFTSCVGAIFGIIGIVNANKANTLYQQGDAAGGDMANSSAKTMTIISLVFAGVSIIGAVILFYSSFVGAF